MSSFALPRVSPSCRAAPSSLGGNLGADSRSTLGHLSTEAKAMAQDVWQTINTPMESLQACKPEATRVYRTLREDKEYRTNLFGRWFNQVGGGLSHGGFLALLGNKTVGSAAAGLLASQAIGYFEDTVAGLAQVHRGILRDVARQSTHSPQEASDQIKSRAASRLIILGVLDAMVMACALGVVAGVSAGLIGSNGLFLALAAMQTVRTAIVIYQFACLDILKVQIKSEGVRDIINRRWTNAINNSEQVLGRRIYSTTLIVCQAASFFMPPAWQLPFTAAQITVGMALSAAGKLQFLPLIMVNSTRDAAASKENLWRT